MLRITPRGPWRTALLAVVACGALVAAGCGSDDGGSSSTSGGSTTASTGEGKKVALLLPQSGAPRFERFDKPFFEKALKRYCPDCELLYANAQNEDAAKQQQQAEAVLANGADVMVVHPVDPDAATAIAELARSKGVPVIANTRPVNNSDNVKAYVTSDTPSLCIAQANAMIRRLDELGTPRGPIVMINGAPTHPEAIRCRDINRRMYDEAGVEVLESFDTPNWDPVKAQQQMEQWITKYGEDRITGVYSVAGIISGPVIAAMKSRGWDLSKHPVTGLDADPGELQRMLADEQYMSVLQRIDLISDGAAKLAADLALGREFDRSMFNRTYDMGSNRDVPTVWIPGLEITKDNIEETLINDDWYSAEEICTGAYRAACARAGIQ